LQECRQVALVLQLRSVPLAKLRPLARVMAVPLPKCCAGGERFQPKLDGGLFLADATRPKALDQNPQGVVLGWCFVSSLQLNHAFSGLRNNTALRFLARP